MAIDKSLIVAYILDGEGGGRAIKWDEIAKWNPEQGILWVHLNYKAKRSAKWLKKDSGLDSMLVQAMLSEETRPRSLVSSQGLLVMLRSVNLNPGQDPEDMVSIRIWIQKDCIITTRHRKLLSVDDVRMAIENGSGPKSASEFLIMLNARILDRVGDVISDIDDQVDGIEEDVITAESRLLRPQIADIRRQTIMIRRYLAPQREALSRLIHQDCSLLSQLDRMHIREATDRVIRYIEDLDSSRERAAVAQEELMSRLSEQMNSRMYVLSLVTVIFLPLAYITGLLGVNLGGIPGAEHEWAFAILVSFLLVVMGIILWLLRLKKWI